MKRLSLAIAAALIASTAAAIDSRSASDFLNSIDVNTHIGQGEDAWADVATAVRYTGHRHVRDNSARLNSLINLYNQTGVSTLMLMGCSNGVATPISRAKTLAAANALLAVEGPNEPNNFPVTYNGRTSSITGTFL